MVIRGAVAAALALALALAQGERDRATTLVTETTIAYTPDLRLEDLPNSG